MNEAKEIIKSDESLKQKIKELIKQVMDEITTTGAVGAISVPNWVSKSKKGRPDLGTVLGYTLAKPVNEAAEPTQQGGEKGQEDPNVYDAKFDLTDFESRVSQSTLQNKGNFQNYECCQHQRWIRVRQWCSVNWRCGHQHWYTAKCECNWQYCNWQLECIGTS